MKVLVNGKAVTLGPKKLLGQGGEACVYKWKDQALKIYHQSTPRALNRRIRKLKQFPAGLPDQVLGPTALVTDTANQPIGFAMRIVEAGEDFKRLGQRNWREGAVTDDEVYDLFADLHRLLTGVHDAGAVVGDLNDCNVLFADDKAWLIDADSMQFGTHRCIVGHERFLDPQLFGVDLTKHSAFTPLTDWYAFNVLLFSSLLYVHPYGGVHKALPTLLRRAEASHSVLRPDVKAPKSAADMRSLPADLRRWFSAVFDNGMRDVFPQRLLGLSAPSFTPVIAAKPPERINGRCRGVKMFDPPRVRPMWAEVRNGWLVNTRNDKRIGTVLDAGTQLRTGERLGYGFYRAGQLTVHFLMRPDRAGLITPQGLPPIRGRLLDFDAVFDDEHALISWVTDHDGKRQGSLHLVRKTGELVASIMADENTFPWITHARGKAVLNGRVVVATDDGLTTLKRDLHPDHIFVDSEPFVAAGDTLIPGPGGSIYVVSNQEVIHVTTLA